jgi:glutamate 5-kinase
MGSDARLDQAFIADLASQIARLTVAGSQVVLVSSGAIAAGLAPLGFERRPQEVDMLQACASVGQVALIQAYSQAFAKEGLSIGQVLLTRNDTGSRSAYLHARLTMERLLELGCVPVVNENDTVAVDEIKFGDNDSLASIVGALVGADLVVLMSDIEGLYTADPHNDPNARLISRVERVDDEILSLASGSSSAVGTGGMATKVRAARATQLAGSSMVICLGRRREVLFQVAMGADIGTRFVPDPEHEPESARKLWIGYAGHDCGSVVIDDGAVAALHSKGGSLLPVGVTDVSGTFSRGDIIAVRDKDGVLIARGISAYSSQEADLTRGMKLDMVGRVVPSLAGVALIHRDELLVF